MGDAGRCDLINLNTKVDNDGGHIYMPRFKWTRGTKIRYEFPGGFLLNADGECFEA